MQQRDKVKINAIKSKSESDFQIYRTIRNNRELKRSYYSNLVLDNLSKSDKLWKAVKKILPSSSTVQTQILRENDKEYTSSRDISNCFNRYFSTIGSKLAAHFKNDSENTTNPYPGVTTHFQFSEIPADFVSKQLKNLKCGKATGLDNLHSRLLKDAAPIIGAPRRGVAFMTGTEVI